jgi:hypothetical protein
MFELIADLLWGLIEFFCWRERDKPEEPLDPDKLGRL